MAKNQKCLIWKNKKISDQKMIFVK